MSTLLKSAALVLCAGVSCAQATETAKQWEFNIGAMYEIENVEGQGDDKDGLYEPSVWFNATWDAWTISLAMYQEGPVDYSSMTRGTYFDRPEFELRYRFIGTDDFTFGLTGGFRNYGYHFKDEHGAKDGSANMQRYKVQPDWDIKLTDDWRLAAGLPCISLLTIWKKPVILTAALKPKRALPGPLTKPLPLK
jgi:outer membrane protein G